MEAVGKVQIIENDQPIKILDSLIFSDRASLNIQLKKFTTTGTGKIGVGFTPFLRDINVTPMTFNKRFQSLNTFQSNNIGNDVSQQLNTLDVGNMFDYQDFSNLSANPNISFLNLQEVASPNFNEKKWLDNNINMLSSNFLQKLNNNLEMKGSVSYVNDYQKKFGQTFTTLFTPGQNIDFKEAINNRYNLNELRGNFILLKNEKNIYFKNNLKISRKWDNNSGNILRNNNEPVYQKNNLQNLNLSNRFTATTFFGRQLITLNSFVSYSQIPQNLSVTPGQFESIFNDNMSYNKVMQDIQFNSFNTDNYISFVKGFKSFTLIPRIGISFQSQELESSISITENNEKIELGNNFRNQIRFITTGAYIDLKSQYKNQKWRIDFKIPLMLLNYSVRDRLRDISYPLKKLTFEPRLLAIYQLNSYWEASASMGYEKKFGAINTLYNAYLLTSYRNLQKFNATIPESNHWGNALSINYKNTLKAVFADFSYTHSLQQKNYLFRNIVDINGFNTIEMTDKTNTQSFQSISGNYSKYFSQIKTIVKVKGSISLSESEYLFENIVGKLISKGYGASLSITNTILDYLSFDYETRVLFINSTLSGKKVNNIFMNNHILGFNFFPVDNHVLSLNSEYYITNSISEKNQVFIDLQYRFKIPKTKIDLEIGFLNLLNNRTYIQLYNSEFSLIRNYFHLRPRQVMVSTVFKF